METRDFLLQQFMALRQEIQARQSRAFWTAVIGLLGVPILSYQAMGAATIVWAIMPFFVLVVIALFLTEQNEMMRCGRYIREHIEPRLEFAPGWEAWLESRSEYRVMEKHFFACFIIVFFVYYFLSIGVALERLWGMASADQSGLYWSYVYGALGAYLFCTIWLIATLLQHWRSSVSTASKAQTGPSA